ncbi:MAG: hypothetical protein ACRC9X_04600, partial [Bacteroidales bacterium]
MRKEHIYINEKDETDNISSYSFRNSKCIITFNNSDKEYSYDQNKVKIVKTAISDDKAYNIFN